jgi:hypothetical protein
MVSARHQRPAKASHAASAIPPRGVGRGLPVATELEGLPFLRISTAEPVPFQSSPLQEPASYQMATPEGSPATLTRASQLADVTTEVVPMPGHSPWTQTAAGASLLRPVNVAGIGYSPYVPKEYPASESEAVLTE